MSVFTIHHFRLSLTFYLLFTALHHCLSVFTEMIQSRKWAEPLLRQAYGSEAHCPSRHHEGSCSERRPASYGVFFARRLGMEPEDELTRHLDLNLPTCDWITKYNTGVGQLYKNSFKAKNSKPKKPNCLSRHGKPNFSFCSILFPSRSLGNLL